MILGNSDIGIFVGWDLSVSRKRREQAEENNKCL
jgi:hypothetical protein